MIPVNSWTCILLSLQVKVLAVRIERVGKSALPISWSNPQGETLTAVRENVWMAERPFFPRIPGLAGTDVGGKMSVVKLSDGTLWVHSPVNLDPDLEAALASIGPVTHIVTPNTEHQKYALQWIQKYPHARSYVCPLLRERQPEIGWTDTIGADVQGNWNPTGPIPWGGEFDICWIDAERGPFMSRPFFSEVVFVHRASKVRILVQSALF
jgi:hypothetical protein